MPAQNQVVEGQGGQCQCCFFSFRIANYGLSMVCMLQEFYKDLLEDKEDLRKKRFWELSRKQGIPKCRFDKMMDDKKVPPALLLSSKRAVLSLF